MKMNDAQLKTIVYTKELETKVAEYKQLSAQFEQLKNKSTNPNSEEAKKLLKMFENNQKEIVELRNKLKSLKEN